MSGPLSLDQFVLLAHGSQERPDQTVHVSNDVPKIGGDTTSRGAWIRDGQGGLKTSTHLHFVGWRFRDHPANLCAVVEDCSEAGRYESGPGRYFRFAEAETQAPEVGWQTPVRVRLQGLDKCLWSLSDVFDTPGTVPPKVSGRREYGEHGRVVFDSGVIEGKLENALVEGGPEVVDDLAQENREIERDGFVIPKVVDVLREVVLYRTANAIGGGLCADVRRFRVGQNLCLVIRSLDFQSNRLNRRMVRFPDVD